MNDSKKLMKTAVLLAERLERLSADSIWAHRSSGMRGSLLKFIEKIEHKTAETDTPYASMNEAELREIKSLLERGFFILENAAREIPEESQS